MKCEHCGTEKRDSCCFLEWQRRTDEKFESVAIWLIPIGLIMFCIGLITMIGVSR